MAENKHYLSSGELRKIAKENRRQTKLYEKKKHRKVSPETYTTQMKDPNNILEIEDLHTFFFTDAGTVKSVNGVTFSIPRGKIVGVVGESGCGKSVTSLSVMQLVQAPQGQVLSGFPLPTLFMTRPARLFPFMKPRPGRTETKRS